MAARARVEPTTLRLKVIDSIKASPCPTQSHTFMHHALNVLDAPGFHLRGGALRPPRIGKGWRGWLGG